MTNELFMQVGNSRQNLLKYYFAVFFLQLSITLIRLVFTPQLHFRVFVPRGAASFLFYVLAERNALEELQHNVDVVFILVVVLVLDYTWVV